MVKDKERRANKRYKMKENKKYPYKNRKRDFNRIKPIKTIISEIGDLGK